MKAIAIKMGRVDETFITLAPPARHFSACRAKKVPMDELYGNRAGELVLPDSAGCESMFFTGPETPGSQREEKDGISEQSCGREQD